MIYHRIEDWDDAYTNGAHIAGGDAWPGRWSEPALAFRDAIRQAGRARLDLAYGAAPRNRFDLFLPEAAPKDNKHDSSSLKQSVITIPGAKVLRRDRSILACGATQTTSRLQRGAGTLRSSTGRCCRFGA